MLGPISLSNILRPCKPRFRGLCVPLNHCFALTLFRWLSGNRRSAMWLQGKNRRCRRGLREGRRSLIGHILARVPSIVTRLKKPAFQNKNYYRNSSLKNRGKLSSRNAIKIVHLRIIPLTITRLRNQKSSTLPHLLNLGSSFMLRAKHMLPLFIEFSQPLWSSTILQSLRWRLVNQQRKDQWIIQRSFSSPIKLTRDFTIEKRLRLKKKMRNYLK